MDFCWSVPSMVSTFMACCSATEFITTDLRVLTIWNQAALPGVRVTRIGLRYVNAFVPARHGVSKVRDLDIVCRVGQVPDSDQFLVGITSRVSPSHTVALRIASPEYVTGTVPEVAAAIVDVDVMTNSDQQFAEARAVTEWINDAHEFEKSAFFGLIPKAVLDKNVETWA